MRRTVLLAVVCAAVLAVAGQVNATPITYQLVTPADNDNGATLQSSFLTTDGTLGSGITLGSILTDWEINFTDSTTNSLTPTNSSIEYDSLDFNVTSSQIIGISGVSAKLVIRKDSSTFLRIARSTPWSWVIVDDDGNYGANGHYVSGRVFASGGTPSPVPEPTTLALFGLGLLGLGIVARRKLRK